jgi:hypothetical protein
MAVAAAWVWIALAQPAGVHARAVFDETQTPDAAARSGLPAICDETPMNSGLAADGGGAVDSAWPSVPPLEEGPVAWCLTPDDPRCSPRDASSLPDASQAPLPLNASRALRLPEPRGQNLPVPYSEPLGAALAGSHSRVERPPRYG